MARAKIELAWFGTAPAPTHFGKCQRRSASFAVFGRRLTLHPVNVFVYLGCPLGTHEFNKGSHEVLFVTRACPSLVKECVHAQSGFKCEKENIGWDGVKKRS